MTDKHQPADVPALALSVDRVAAAVGLPENTFRRLVLPHLRSVQVDRAKLIAVRELERWLDVNGRFADEDS